MGLKCIGHNFWDFFGEGDFGVMPFLGQAPLAAPEGASCEPEVLTTTINRSMGDRPVENVLGLVKIGEIGGGGK